MIASLACFSLGELACCTPELRASAKLSQRRRPPAQQAIAVIPQRTLRESALMFPDVLRVGNREPSFRFGYSILRHLHAMSRRFDLFENFVPIALPQACSVHPKNGRRKKSNKFNFHTTVSCHASRHNITGAGPGVGSPVLPQAPRDLDGEFISRL